MLCDFRYRVASRTAVLIGGAALALVTGCAETLIRTATWLDCDEPEKRSLRLGGGQAITGLGVVRAGFDVHQVRGEEPTVSWHAYADSLQPHVTGVSLLDGRDSTALFELPLVPEDVLRQRFPGGPGNVSGGREPYRGTVPVDEVFDAVKEHGVWFEVRTDHPDHPVLRFWARPFELYGWARWCPNRLTPGAAESPEAKRARCGERKRTLSLHAGEYAKPEPYAAGISLSEESDPTPVPIRRLTWSLRGIVPLDTVREVTIRDARTRDVILRLPLGDAQFHGTRDRGNLPPSGFSIYGHEMCWPPLPCWDRSFLDGSPPYLDLWERLGEHGALFEIRTTDAARPPVVLSSRKIERDWSRRSEGKKEGC